MEEMAQYCYNPVTKEIVEGRVGPSVDFVPIIGYFPRNLDPVELQKQIEEIAPYQESGLDADHYAEDDEEENVQPQAATNSNIPPPQPTN